LPCESIQESKVLTRDLAKRIESKEADVYQVLSILRCGPPSLGKDADYKGSLAYTLFKCLVCAGIQTIVAPLVVIAKFYEALSQDQFELCQQDWKNDWIGKVVSFAFAWYIFVQFLVAMRNATLLDFSPPPQEYNPQCPWYSIHLGLYRQFDFGMLYSVGVSVFNVLDVG
jgi:hypothetical protein